VCDGLGSGTGLYDGCGRLLFYGMVARFWGAAGMIYAAKRQRNGGCAGMCFGGIYAAGRMDN